MLYFKSPLTTDNYCVNTNEMTRLEIETAINLLRPLIENKAGISFVAFLGPRGRSPATINHYALFANLSGTNADYFFPGVTNEQ